jgi:hypothetical protein
VAFDDVFAQIPLPSWRGLTWETVSFGRREPTAIVTYFDSRESGQRAAQVDVDPTPAWVAADSLVDQDLDHLLDAARVAYCREALGCAHVEAVLR